MSKKTILILAAAGLGFAAPRPASSQSAGAPGASFEALTSATVARMSALSHAVRASQPAAVLAQDAGQFRAWDIASNNSNAREIYSTLVQAGGSPVCQDQRIVTDGNPHTKQACSVAAQVAHLTVEINNIFWRSTTEVDVQGEARCEQRWLTIPEGRHETAELWYFCQFSGVARPQ